MNTRTLFEKISIVTFLMVLVMVAGLLGLAASPVSARSVTADSDFTAVDEYIEKQIADLKIPGLGLAIVQGDQSLYVNGYGKAGPGKGPVTPETSFMIGSTTKAFTALAIMQLVEAGLVELDAPVQTYLPWFRVANPQDSARITIRHLLNQTSGFSNAAGLTEQVAHDQSDNALENSVHRLADVDLVRAPGAAHEYSNLNFSILGMVVQTVSGQSYESYVQEHIFDPLEMRHSFTSQDEAIQDGMATGYLTWFGTRLPKTVPFNRGNLPNGYLICSAEDMAHYLIAQLSDGRYGNASVLSPQGVADLHEPAVATGEPDQFYGMAWYTKTADGETTVYHSGDNSNFQTFLLLFPEKKLGVAVMMNVNGIPVRNRADEIARGVAALVQGGQPEPHVTDTSPMYILAMGSAYLPITLSILWVAWMVFRYFRRQKHGIPARRSFWWYLWVIVLPVLIDLALLWVLLLGIPKLWGLPLAGMAVFFADLFTLIVVSALALVTWGSLGTVLTLRQVEASPQAAL